VSGRVVLVGAGPGDPDLVTVRGAELLRRADVVVYDSLVARELLELAPAEAERVDVGKRSHEALTDSQAEIERLLVDRARGGKLVVRLKGGDPFVFGRGGEEASACRAAGIPFEVVPGVTSALAAPAFAGIPVTDRRHAASFAVVTGHRDPGRSWTSIRWESIATGADTLVVLMGMKNLEKIVEALLAHGRGPDTPAAVVMEGGTPRQRVATAPLGELAVRAREAGLRAPAVVVVGDVVRLRDELGWWDRAPLFGRRVLVTRPAEQCAEWASALREAGADPVCVPMIETRAVEGPGLAEAMREIAAYDIVVFTSANAVRYFADAIASHELPAGALRARIVCVGPATAAAARRTGFDGAETPSPRADAASLVEVLRASGVGGQRVLVPHGSLSSDAFVRGLCDAGARVDAVTVYETVAADVDAAALRAALVSGELDALCFASPSAAKQFAACLDDAARAAARRAVVAAIGATTAAALRALALAPQVIPEQPGAQALVEALAAHFAGRRGDPS
jgi:uroporphyrinogen III methyltransferase/synthase